jgi:DNA-binding MurR/RpiR family transcriptional regulator
MDLSGSVKEQIANSLENLSPKHKQVARFVLENYYFTSFASANQLGERVGTSGATVVRFAQALGYTGYPELQEALRSDFQNYMTTAARMKKRMSEPVPPASTSHQVLYMDIKNIEQTGSNLSEEHLNSSIEAIQKAKRIFVIGAGLSYTAVVFLVHELQVMGFEAFAVQAEGLQAAVEIARVKPDDLIIAVDLWRYVRMTVNAVARAKEIGTPVIAITDSIVSPLSKMADIAFEFASEGVVHSLSVTALLSLLNIFVALLAYRVPEQVYESLKQVDAAYRDNDLLIM